MFYNRLLSVSRPKVVIESQRLRCGGVSVHLKDARGAVREALSPFESFDGRDAIESARNRYQSRSGKRRHVLLGRPSG
jgi:hypothetical protein